MTATQNVITNGQPLWCWGSNTVTGNYFTVTGHEDIVANAGPRP